MASERYAPAGLLIERHGRAIMIDGGPGAEPDRPVEDWLLRDERAELIAKIRRMAREKFSVRPACRLCLARRPADRRRAGRARATYGYRIQLGNSMAAWAPEFLEFPRWATSAKIMFADTAGWNRPIRFAKRVGGHAAGARGCRGCTGDECRATRVRPCGETDDPCPRCRHVVPFGELDQERTTHELT
jgi:hypothetical protein